ncbi:MAG: phosphonate ABC transporter, permease protein PhnE, partial [Candidatus Hydrogenedentes bacterium]|nr:phosphonate ABC transporter, permease protein PhnE [Candidatus Hydrogenedentota bacterium]
MSHPTTWKRPGMFENPATRYWLWAAMVAYLVWTLFFDIKVDWGRVLTGLPRATDMISRMFPPDYSRWDLLVRGIVESVQMAFAASFIGMALAVPLGLAAARNLSPLPVYLTARAVLVLSRTFHEII